jgi:hypothetical protein
MQRAYSNPTGIYWYPFNPDRVLAKLPEEDRESVVSGIHQQLLKKLSAMRYSPTGNTGAQQPKKRTDFRQAPHIPAHLAARLSLLRSKLMMWLLATPGIFHPPEIMLT